MTAPGRRVGDAANGFDRWWKIAEAEGIPIDKDEGFVLAVIRAHAQAAYMAGVIRGREMERANAAKRGAK